MSTVHERRWGRPGPPLRAPAYLMPLGVAAIQVMGTFFASRHHPGGRAFDLGAVVLLVAGPAALSIRRRFPTGVLAFVAVTTLAYVLLRYPKGPIFLALIVAFFTAVMRGRRLAAMATLVAGYVAFLWGGYLVGIESAPGWGAALGLGAWLLVLATAAEAARGRRERGMEYARSQREEARRQASEERLRIARELHDVLAHNISLMNVQAGVALHLIDDQPEQARSALKAIKDASNQALGELRSVLDVLRQRDEAPPRSPTSGMADLDELLTKTQAAGVPITTVIEGSPRPLSAKTDLAAFRIIQEALTNVTRHAANGPTTVRVDYGPEQLTIQIHNEGNFASRTSSGSGNGIPGMRERAAALGGEVEARLTGSGFEVRARLPLPSSFGEPA